MRINGSGRLIAGAVLLWSAATALPVHAAGGSSESITSTVAVDRRSGRLVRRIVVPERLIPARVVGSSAAAGAPFSALSGSGQPLSEMVDEIAGQHRVDPLLVHAVIQTESAYNRLAVSPKGAEGLMQLIPDTARRFGVRNSFDSRQNIEGGVKYLRELQERFSDLRHVLAAYNAGEKAVERYGGIPPYSETQDYVYKVGKRYGDLRRAAPKRPATAAAVHPAAAPVQPEYRPLTSYVDAEGRLHLQTR